MTTNRLSYLLKQYTDQTITAPELDELKPILKDEAYSGILSELINEQLQQVHLPFGDAARFEHLVQRAVNIDKVVDTESLVRRIPLYRRWWAAASIVLVMGISAYIWTSYKKDTSPTVIAEQTEEIAPGKKGAVLTLADGKLVVLDSLGNGMIAQQSGSQALIKDGELFYSVTGEVAGEEEFNTMTTPKGRQFSLQLQDGTRVWLNAASSIRYPTIFSGKERRVTITGEVYFEVAQNAKMPFHVNVRDGAHVTVLGTSFNVNAYENEPSINATLIAGSIRVAANASDHLQLPEPVLLLPGQQAQINYATTSIKVNVVADTDIEKAMAWKNGLFNFNDLPFDEIMRQVERWYDIRVVYANNKVINKRLIGKMTRDVPLDGLLKYMEKLGVRYTLEDRTLFITP